MQAYQSGVRGVKEAISPLPLGNPFEKEADTCTVHAGIKEYLLLLSKAIFHEVHPCFVACSVRAVRLFCSMVAGLMH